MKNTTNLFLQILSDHWKNFKRYRSQYATPYYDEIIKKVLFCADPQQGYVKYKCTNCGQDEKVIGLTYKHSFSLRCGSIKAMKFVEEVTVKMYSCITYKHLTLTMLDVLWREFYNGCF